MYEELQAKSKVQMWSKDRLQLEVSQLPHGGYIIVHVSGPTIGSANTEWFEYIVQTMNGEEILRKQGDYDIPEYTISQYGTKWWNIDIIYLKDKIQVSFKVYVVDKSSNRRSGFIVYPNQINR